ncbi:O-acyltransferase like protein-like [Mizuhopecten yessoensis]|uniref:Nose resistant to fluoxetine protein 6 n=1 Tax=Mizuhopecten yessoensis TaxID=6573 RepID=A0A210QXD8_MIZYE|nr:O-acyltransferase like protein-like [Mizuhopecten yessoensis]OWF53373.1 Nose resistant to fluoxetine protein 6 [Mizuhopecten yessoensis]
MRTLLAVGTVLVLVFCFGDVYSDATAAKPTIQNQDYFSLLEKGIEVLLSNVSSTQSLSQLSNLASLFPAMNVQNVQKILHSLNVPIPSGPQFNATLKLLQSTGQSVASKFTSGQKSYKMLSPACSSAMGMLGSQFLAQKQWALKMVDSWGKPRAGLLEGNVKWRGMYDECMNTVAEIDGKVVFEPNSCGVNIPTSISGPSGNVNIVIRMCLPSVCTGGDPYFIADSILALIPTTPPLTANFGWCQEEPEYDLRTTITICVCGAFLALMTLATLFDVFVVRQQQKKTTKTPIETEFNKNGIIPVTVIGEGNSPQNVEDNSPVKNGTIQTNGYSIDNVPAVETKYTGLCSKLLLSFSVWTNGRKLLSAKQTGGTMGAINGIRFLSMTWVILGHTYIFLLLQGALVNTAPFASQMLKRRSFMAITNALLSVDTFFTLSGLLVAYVFMKEMKREKGRINWFMFYFHRFWRLTPPYMMVMMLDIVLFRYLGDGPMWSVTGLETDYCKDSWWTNLIYVNNLVKTDKMCFGWSWYLANDMQFYVISPIILVPLYFSKKIGSAIAVLFLLGTTIASGVISKTYELPSTQYSMVPNPHSGDYFEKYYIKPYCRMGPYIIGMMTGYILYRTKGKYNMKPPVSLFIWIVMTTLACLVIYGVYDETSGKTAMSVNVAALYNAVHKTLWGVCVSWVIFACVTGNGGYINTILSWSPFVPLGRLTYCAYLVHPIIIFVYIRSLRQAVYATDFVMIYQFLGHLVTAYGVAFVVSLTFESPMMGLERAIFRRGKKKNQ